MAIVNNIICLQTFLLPDIGLTSDTYMWLSALLAVEFVLLECLNLNLYRSLSFSGFD
jgi:hypothetical protein